MMIDLQYFCHDLKNILILFADECEVFKPMVQKNHDWSKTLFIYFRTPTKYF
jgi:hypothetical protein